MIVPTLCVGMQPVTLCVTGDAERPLRHSHAERGNDQDQMWELAREEAGNGNTDFQARRASSRSAAHNAIRRHASASFS